MTEETDKLPVTEKPRVIALDPDPKGKGKAIGGGLCDQWNDRLTTLVVTALPVNQQNADAVSEAGAGAISGMVDMKPADPIEGVLISHIVVANEAAMKLYRLGWANSCEYFDESIKYLQRADRAARTVAMLTERLDHHRNQGKQQILVQHTTTVNADQAVIANSLVSGKAAPSAKLLAAVADNPMEVLKPTQKETTTVEGGGTKPK